MSETISDTGLPTEKVQEIRRAWQSANVTPLWETTVHRVDKAPPRGHHWKWTDIRPLIDQAIAVTTTENAERRVLALTNPDARGGRNTVTNINTNFQVLMPGEKARPHRHTANALRFVVEGSGGETIVDGKSCPMMPGDLVVTPGWSWHEHVHRGASPLVWLDVLDVPLHQYLGTQVYEPGPVRDLPITPDDGAFAQAGIAPDLGGSAVPYTPLFRYPREGWTKVLDAAPRGRDGVQRVRFIHPETGQPAMSLIDCSMVRLRQGEPTTPTSTNANEVAFVVEGKGRSRVGDDVFEWNPNDVFTMPGRTWISHECSSPDATLLIISDREVLRRLGLLTEARADQPVR